MGKGGTKFDENAIGHRSRGGSAISGKEARKNMETFLRTGKHPLLEQSSDLEVQDLHVSPTNHRSPIALDGIFGSDQPLAHGRSGQGFLNSGERGKAGLGSLPVDVETGPQGLVHGNKFLLIIAQAEDLAAMASRGQFDDNGALPARNAHRPHVFLSVQLGPENFAHMQIELFDDMNPIAARAFRLLCLGSEEDGHIASASYRHVPFHKVLPNQYVEGGNIQLGRGSEQLKGSREQPGAKLSHVCAGIVSIAPSGTQFIMTLAAARHLDSKWVVVGRIVGGHLAVTQIAEALQENVKNESMPVPFVADCGTVSSSGLSDAALAQLFEARQAANQSALMQTKELKSETPAQTAERLKLESAKRKQEIRSSLQEGLNEAKRQKSIQASSGPVGKTVMWNTFDSDVSDSSSEDD